MEGVDAVGEENNDVPRRSLRLALSELNEITTFQNTNTPCKSTSPDEMIIIQRGPRRKPITWSPVEYDRTRLLAPPRDKTPEPIPQKSEINPKLRRRLIMSPGKNQGSQDLGMVIAKKLRSLKNLERSVQIS